MRHNDEIFHAGWLLIEHHYLKYYGKYIQKYFNHIFVNFVLGASFSENFYGLKRQRVTPLSGLGTGKDTTFEMTGKDKLFSLLLLV